MNHRKVEAGGSTWARSKWDCLTSDYIPIDHGIGAGGSCQRERCQRNGRDPDALLFFYFHVFFPFLCLLLTRFGFLCFIGFWFFRRRAPDLSCHQSGRFSLPNHATGFEIFLGRKKAVEDCAEFPLVWRDSRISGWAAPPGEISMSAHYCSRAR
jgi:hypothetical protein